MHLRRDTAAGSQPEGWTTRFDLGSAGGACVTLLVNLQGFHATGQVSASCELWSVDRGAVSPPSDPTAWWRLLKASGIQEQRLDYFVVGVTYAIWKRLEEGWQSTMQAAQPQISTEAVLPLILSGLGLEKAAADLNVP